MTAHNCSIGLFSLAEGLSTANTNESIKSLMKGKSKADQESIEKQLTNIDLKNFYSQRRSQLTGQEVLYLNRLASYRGSVEEKSDQLAFETAFQIMEMTPVGAQVQVSQAFDTERRTYRLEMAQDEQKLRKEAEEARKQGNIAIYDAKIKEADKQQEKMVLFDSITGAIYGPNTNGVTGYVARAVAPQVSYQIGQYFKGTNGEGTAPHILAHGILAAAVSSATGNDPTTGALSAMGAEAAAPMVAKFLFGDKPISELTAEQKATVSSITSLAGLGLGATTGDVGSAVSAGEAAKTAVNDNAVNNPVQAYIIERKKKYGTDISLINYKLANGQLVLNKDLADYLYIINKDPNLVVNMYLKEPITVVITGDENEWRTNNAKQNEEINSARISYKDFGVWAVLGKVVVSRNKTNKSDYRLINDDYSFEMQNGLKNIPRNIETQIGSPKLNGTPYKIHIINQDMVKYE